VIQIEVGDYGEKPKRIAREVGLKTRPAAEAKAKEIATSHEQHGFNDQYGFWWYRGEGKLYRLIVE
jgi:hypothetical protein